MLHKTLFVFLSLYCFWVNSVFSQDFEVAPVLLNFSVDPGNSETQVVTIRNHSDKKQTFTLSLGDMVKDSLGNRRTLPPGTTDRSCANWITINPSFFNLNPNQTNEVDVTMRVPSDGYSTRWAQIFVRTAEEQTAKSAEKVVTTGIRVSPRITINVYQSPGTNKKFKAIISDLKEISGPQDTIRIFSVRIDNIGDKRLAAKIYLIASNLETGNESKFTPVTLTLLPDDRKDAKLMLPPSLAKGTYSLAAILDYGNNTALEAVQMTIQIK